MLVSHEGHLRLSIPFPPLPPHCIQGCFRHVGTRPNSLGCLLPTPQPVPRLGQLYNTGEATGFLSRRGGGKHFLFFC